MPAFTNASPPLSETSIAIENVTFESIKESADYLKERTKYRPKIGIICGSGLGHLADNFVNSDSFPYSDIPNFPSSAVAGHANRMVFGLLNGVEIMAMQGRFHTYEGYSLKLCSMPVRVMKFVGCTHIIVTNAAGGLNPDYKVGDVMIVKDHINVMGFAGNSALFGPNDDRFGPRFFSMNDAYDPELIEIAENLAIELGIQNDVKTGVLTALGGPNYETVAELKMWHLLGVDAVGMSTIHEVTTGRHCDLKCFAFSLITNKCVTQYNTREVANHEEVIRTGQERQGILTNFVSKLIEKFNEKINSNVS